MRDDTYLLSLALVEATLLEQGETISTIAQTIRADDSAIEVVQALTLILASTLESAAGSVGQAVEQIDRWRHSVLTGLYRESESKARDA